MAYEQRNNSGSLFKNDHKKADKHPDYKGTALIDGVKKDISAWIKNSKNGTKYMSVSFQEPYNKEQKTAYETTFEDNEDVPF